MKNNILEWFEINNKDANTIVDLQKTFSENRVWENEGALKVPNTRWLEIITNKFIDYFKSKSWIILASKELHWRGHISFASSFVGKKPITEVWNIDKRAFISYDEVKNWTEQNNGLSGSAKFTIDELKIYLKIRWTEVMWPDHAQDYNSESEFVSWLEEDKIDEIFIKWDNIAEHTYSAFSAKNYKWILLADRMRERKIERNFVSSLATDYCAWETAMDSVKEWFDTYFVEPLSRSVYPENNEMALEKLQDNWVKIIRS